MNEDMNDLVELYALGALEGDEAARFEAHLATDPDLQQELRATEELLSGLASGDAVAPPSQLKDAVMGAIAQTPQESAQPEIIGQPSNESDVVVDLNAERARRPRFVPLAAAACLAIVALLVGAIALRPTTGFTEVAGAADAQEIVLDAAGDVDADITIAWSPSRGELGIQASNLPDLPADKTYELWLIDDGAPVPSGLFRPDADGDVDFVGDLNGDPAVWAITIEDAEGADAPTTDPIFVGETT